jgi:hypothetical protein
MQPEGAAELLVAPPRETLVATAAAVSAACGCGAFRFDDAFEERDVPDAGFAERATCAMARRAVPAAQSGARGVLQAPPAECARELCGDGA